MLNRHWKISIVVAILSVATVVYMYSKNYISFEGGLHIILPQPANKSFTESEFEPANTQPTEVDTNEMSRPVPIKPSSGDIVSNNEGPRFFDDAMVAVETFSPILTPFITFYFLRKKKGENNNIET